MGKNLEINFKLEKYIEELSYNLHPIQQEIIKYNDSLGDIKRMQISVSQCHFLHLRTKISKIKSTGRGTSSSLCAAVKCAVCGSQKVMSNRAGWSGGLPRESSYSQAIHEIHKFGASLSMR